MKHLRIIIPSVIGLLILGWLGWQVYIFTLPADEKLLRDETVQRDLLYCEQGEERLLLDYYPAERGAGLVIHIHGGIWRSGNRLPNTPAAELITELRDAGLNVASIDYRLAPAHRLSAMTADVSCAIDYLQRRGHELGFDPGRTGLLGPSTGGHLSLLSAGQRKANGRNTVQAVAALFAPTNFSSPHQLWLVQPADFHDKLMQDLFEEPDEKQLREASPLSYARYLDIPTLLVYGDRDQVVGPGQGMDLYWRLRLLGQPTEFLLVKDSGHLTPLSENSEPDWDGLSQQVAAFFVRHLQADN